MHFKELEEMFATWFPCSFPLVLHDEYLEITSPVPSPQSLSIDLGGSIHVVLTPGDSKFRPVLSPRAAGYIGESCFLSLVPLPLGRHRCLLYMVLEWAGQCSPLKEQGFCMQLKLNCHFKIDQYNYKMFYVIHKVTAKKIPIEYEQKKVRNKSKHVTIKNQ